MSTSAREPGRVHPRGWAPAVAVFVAACGGTVVAPDDEGVGGASGASTAAFGASSGGVSPPEGTTCDDPVPVLQSSGAPSGFLRCASGMVHRTEAAACDSPQPTDSCKFTGGECETAADCTERALGACVQDFEFYPCECAYGCRTDDDCDEGSLCACAGVVGDRARCVPATCAAPDDCPGGACALDAGPGPCGDWSGSAACVDATSPCRSDADCSGTLFCQGESEEVPETCELRYVSDSELAFTCGEPGRCGFCG